MKNQKQVFISSFFKFRNKEFSILEAIGNTPLVRINNLNKNPHIGARCRSRTMAFQETSSFLDNKITIFGKLEGLNPGGSVKDRPAYYMIKKAEELGQLTKEKIIIEPTSGNTGISLAMIAAVKGYKVKLVMPECVSIERRRLIEAFGAQLLLTPEKEGTDGAIKKAHQILKRNPEKYFLPNQFDNENNILAHYETTGPEIWHQTKGKITHFVAGMGTGGTLMGVGKYLKEKNRKIKVIGVEPKKGHKIQGLKNMEESIIPKIYHPELLDEKIIIGDDEAFGTTRILAKREGLFVGISSGAAVAGALRVAEKIKSGLIVVILPDRGDRYLSTTLFRSICAKCPP